MNRCYLVNCQLLKTKLDPDENSAANTQPQAR